MPNDYDLTNTIARGVLLVVVLLVAYFILKGEKPKK